jgi:hypothetical protein
MTISSATNDSTKDTDSTAGDNVVFWPHKRRCRFKNCPIGLFKHGDTIALMTEYASTHALGTYRDAYIVSSGEAFWGGVSTGVERDELMVTPLALGESD